MVGIVLRTIRVQTAPFAVWNPFPSLRLNGHEGLRSPEVAAEQYCRISCEFGSRREDMIPPLAA